MGSAITALRARARLGLAIMAMDPHNRRRAEQWAFWQAYAKALRDVQGAGPMLAAADAASGGHHMPGYCLAAVQALGDHIETLPIGQVDQLLAQAGVQVGAA